MGGGADYTAPDLGCSGHEDERPSSGRPQGDRSRDAETDQTTAPTADGGTGNSGLGTSSEVLVAPLLRWRLRHPMPDSEASRNTLNYRGGGLTGNRYPSCVP